MRETEPNQTN